MTKYEQKSNINLTVIIINNVINYRYRGLKYIIEKSYKQAYLFKF